MLRPFLSTLPLFAFWAVSELPACERNRYSYYHCEPVKRFNATLSCKAAPSDSCLLRGKRDDASIALTTGNDSAISANTQTSEGDNLHSWWHAFPLRLSLSFSLFLSRLSRRQTCWLAGRTLRLSVFRCFGVSAINKQAVFVRVAVGSVVQGDWFQCNCNRLNGAEDWLGIVNQIKGD